MVANLRKLLEDEREWVVAASIAVLDGQSSHFDVNDEGDVIVSCVTHLHGVPIWANLDSLAGGSDGSGVWHIPDPGTEVMVGFDHGDFEGEAHIVSRGSGGRAPQGLGPGIVFVLGNNVQIRTPGGTATKLPTFDDVQQLRNKVESLRTAHNTHTHPATSGTTSATLDGLVTGATPTPAGTTVLEAE